MHTSSPTPFGRAACGGIPLALILGLAFLPAGCRSATEPKDYSRSLLPGQHALVRVAPGEAPDLDLAFDGDADLIQALDESLAYFDHPSSRRGYPYRTSDRWITREDQIASLRRFRELWRESRTGQEFARRVAEEFDVYRSVGWDGSSGEVLFTGYYTPIFEARRTPDGRFRYPLYGRPQDLVADETGKPLGRKTAGGEVVPYYTREEIERGNLLAGNELVYLKDPFEVYIVHVQGSAWLRMESGEIQHVGYAGKTDQPYASVANELVRLGRLRRDEISLDRLRRHFREQPEDLPLLFVNRSFVFFAPTEPGPFGSLGVRVTPYHSIATDKLVFPPGGVVVVDTQLPTALAADSRHTVRHVGIYLDQDTGGAIRSAGRADLYLGVGPAAERRAGTMRHEGEMYYYFLRPQLRGADVGANPDLRSSGPEGRASNRP